MDSILFARARVALKFGFALKSGESVALVTDTNTDEILSRAFLRAIEAEGGQVTHIGYEPLRWIPMKKFGVFAEASLGLYPVGWPEPVLAAARVVDCVVVLTSDLQTIFQKEFRQIATERRVAWLPYLDGAQAARLLPETEEEVLFLDHVTSVVGEAVSQADEVHVTSPGGTDLRLRLGDYPVNWGTGVYHEGQGYGGLELWPGGQISRMPNDGTAQGTLVIDRSINAPEYKELVDPIVFTVEDGYVTNLEGGVEANRLKAFLAARDDDGEQFHVTELGIGTNPRCEFAGIAGPSEDTHTDGCVSFALGADTHLGGNTSAGCHIDMTMYGATAFLDGIPVVEKGRRVVG